MNNSIKNVGSGLLLLRAMLLLLVVNSYTYAQTATNTCPSTTVNLMTRVTGTPPASTIITWHTGTPATDGNRVAFPTSVGAGVYYAAYYDVASMCYGNTTGSLTVTINACPPINNICPATTVNLTARVTGTPPVGTVVTWHTGTPATAANQVATPSSVGTGTYYAAYYDVASMCYGSTTSPLSVAIVPCSVALQARVYLQGALIGVPLPDLLMRDDLRTKGLLPVTSPYPALGLNGITTANTSTAAVVGTGSPSGTDAIVDWVFVELRSASSPTTVLDSRSALVQRDGDIVDVDGVSPVTFTSATAASYYVSVRHRNHLGVMTQGVLPLGNPGTIVDFRQPATPTFNLDPASTSNVPQVIVVQGVAMWAGNVNFDARVIYQGTQNDVATLYQQVISDGGNTLGSPSYKLRSYNAADINMDGEGIFQGSQNDAEVIYTNIVNNHPGNSVTKQTFFIIREQTP